MQIVDLPPQEYNFIGILVGYGVRGRGNHRVDEFEIYQINEGVQCHPGEEHLFVIELTTRPIYSTSDMYVTASLHDFMVEGGGFSFRKSAAYFHDPFSPVKCSGGQMAVETTRSRLAKIFDTFHDFNFRWKK